MLAVFRGKASAAEMAHRERAWAAWHTAYLARIPVAKGVVFPGLETLIPDAGKPAARRADREFGEDEWRAFLLRVEAMSKRVAPS